MNKNFEIISSGGYSTLWVKDLPYAAGSGDASDVNPFNPKDDRPLIDGEWLQYSSTAGKLTRGGNNAMAVSGTPDSEGSVMAFPYFMEAGRTDSQFKKLAHIIIGPYGFEFRTKIVYSTGLSVNSAVSVWDWDGPSGDYGLVRRALALQVGGFIIGRVTRVFGTNDVSVFFQPAAA